MKKNIFLPIALVLLICGLLNTPSASAQTKNYDAYTLFVYNFIKHVNWPVNDKASYSIAVMEDALQAENMKNSLDGRKINNKTIAVRVIKESDALAEFDVIYIPFGKSGITDKVVANTLNLPILIITERDDQLKKGACIGFTTLDDGSLRFRLNEVEIGKRKLQISQSLKTLALT